MHLGATDGGTWGCTGLGGEAGGGVKNGPEVPGVSPFPLTWWWPHFLCWAAVEFRWAQAQPVLGAWLVGVSCRCFWRDSQKPGRQLLHTGLWPKRRRGLRGDFCAQVPVVQEGNWLGRARPKSRSEIQPQDPGAGAGHSGPTRPDCSFILCHFSALPQVGAQLPRFSKPDRKSVV